MAVIGEMKVSVIGFDPTEQTIARGIVKAMGEGGLNPEKARLVGECVAEAVAAYQMKAEQITQRTSFFAGVGDAGVLSPDEIRGDAP